MHGVGEHSASYDAGTLEASEGFVKYYRWVVGRLGGSIHGRTLEVGAGTGAMSGRIAHLCDEMVLVEPAENLCAMLEQRFAAQPQLTVRSGALEDAVAADPATFELGFDSIVSFNVLEHIPDDVGTLRTARSLLRPTGRVVLFVPSMPFLYGAIDAQVDHQRRYTKRSLATAITAAGLEVEHMEYLDFLGMIPWFFVGRVLRRTVEGGGVGAYDRFVIPVCRAFDRLTGPPVGKNLIAVARHVVR